MPTINTAQSIVSAQSSRNSTAKEEVGGLIFQFVLRLGSGVWLKALQPSIKGNREETKSKKIKEWRLNKASLLAIQIKSLIAPSSPSA